MAIPRSVTDTMAYLMDKLTPLYPIHEARSIVLWLLEDRCGMTRGELLSGKGNILTDNVLSLIEKDIVGLMNHEPIQYVLGHSWFYGRRFNVSPAVLIPRPETEELVHKVIESYKGSKEKVTILDVGTGSGCIAITLAAELPMAQVTAMDIDAGALKTAKLNANQLKQELSWVQGDALKTLPEIMGGWDAVVSNPPYVWESDKAEMWKNVLSYEPHKALFVPDTNADIFYHAIATHALPLLKHSGRLFFEIHEKMGAHLCEMLEEMGYISIELFNDIRGKERIIVAQKP